MQRKHNELSTEKGFTLLELMIVIAIAAIIAAIAVPSLENSKIRANMIHANNQLKTTLSKMKSRAFTSGRPITLCPITGASAVGPAALNSVPSPANPGVVIRCSANWNAFSNGTAYDSGNAPADLGWIVFENVNGNGIKEANERLIHIEVFNRNLRGRLQIRKNNTARLTLGPDGSTGGPPATFAVAFSRKASEQISAPRVTPTGYEKKRNEFSVSSLGVIQTKVIK